ncbi:hypothetical protein BSKO_05433 [Bryopsis sp. KO-2023]|nr:hypothetical protein BSKO_05433 [Bryopsis sp. KO-2023]
MAPRPMASARVLALLAPVLLSILCWSPASAFFSYEDATSVVEGASFPSHTIKGPCGYSSVALSNHWQTGTFGKVRSYGGRCRAWFPYKSKERKLDEPFYVLTFSGSFNTKGYEYKWEWLSTVATQRSPECVPVTRGDFSPMSIPYRGDNGCLVGKGIVSRYRGWFPYKGKEIRKSGGWLSRNAKVLCVVSVGRRKLELTWVEDISGRLFSKRPVEVFNEPYVNYGGGVITRVAKRTYKEINGATYEKVSGWRTKVGVEISSTPLATAFATFKASGEAERHGSYSTSKKRVTEVTKEDSWTFQVQPHTRTVVSAVVYREKLDIRYRGIEKFYSSSGKYISSRRVSGTWKGVSTNAGAWTITEEPLHL